MPLNQKETEMENTKETVGAVCNWLKGLGAQIIETEYVCDAGCVEAVCIDDGELVFTAIKTKGDLELTNEPNDDGFKAQMKAVAASYLQSHDAQDRKIRFDLISVKHSGTGMALLVRRTDIFPSNSVKRDLATKRTTSNKSNTPNNAKGRKDHGR
jgi:Holliday junction resolvase-like predicted endonuclease